MASFTYTVWSDASLPELMGQLQIVFEKLKFDLINPNSGRIHLWKANGVDIELAALPPLENSELPVGVQWWRAEDDIYVSISESPTAGGYICRVTLTGISREEQAEIARLLLIYVLPAKQRFPEDLFVFQLSAE